MHAHPSRPSSASSAAAPATALATSGHATPGSPFAADRLPTLLIADDDDDLRGLLAAQLARHFKVVASARNAEEAIALGVEQQPDAALIDMQMPGGGGLRATRELHRQAPTTAIVALSGDESDADVRSVIAAGAITYLRKGISRAELAVALRDAIDVHAQLRGSR